MDHVLWDIDMRAAREQHCPATKQLTSKLHREAKCSVKHSWLPHCPPWDLWRYSVRIRGGTPTCCPSGRTLKNRSELGTQDVVHAATALVRDIALAPCRICALQRSGVLHHVLSNSDPWQSLCWPGQTT